MTRAARTARTAGAAAAEAATTAYTSMEAASISGVPFFTVDYWDRSRFLRPSLAASRGRGRGRERRYSYADVLRLRVARELRDERVSLETLRRVIQKLGECADDLVSARFVLVRQDVEMADDLAELTAILGRPGRRSFGVLLDLSAAAATVAKRARKVEAAARRRARRGGF